MKNAHSRQLIVAYLSFAVENVIYYGILV